MSPLNWYKQLHYDHADLDLSEAYNVANQVMLNNLRLKDTQMGIQAFLNKQPIPDWTHEDD
ncbi:hypothetical protein X801_00223 [Opisthorchis viverrini]|uniref:Uncharacterized protein n=1 Tax=Opisthorchis viverrini TaxID=6198 RepID=A0A1S8XBP7_OPIVI|nr:hypothetical protein X801_00223 [Opisthorchis viverrini]